jgi:hypothetical protein
MTIAVRRLADVAIPSIARHLQGRSKESLKIIANRFTPRIGYV